LQAAEDPVFCDTASVIVDAMVASGLFRSFSLWSIVGIAAARLISQPIFAVKNAEEGGNLEIPTMQEVIVV
jgi:hypothetical protein